MNSLHFHSKSNLSVTHINTYTHWTVFFSFIFRLFAFDPLTPFYSFQLVNVSTEICRFRFVVWNCCSRYHILMLNFHLSCKRWWNIFDFTWIQTLILSKALQKKNNILIWFGNMLVSFSSRYVCVQTVSRRLYNWYEFDSVSEDSTRATLNVFCFVLLVCCMYNTVEPLLVSCIHTVDIRTELNSILPNEQHIHTQSERESNRVPSIECM